MEPFLLGWWHPSPSCSMSGARKFTAELLGTMILTYAVGAASIGDLPVPLLAAVTLGVLVYLFGGISGAHLNPAVSVGLWSAGKLPAIDTARYVLAQICGAVLALVAFVAQAADSLPPVFLGSLPEFLGEAIGAFILVFTVASVVAGRIKEDASGIAIGGSLLVGVTIAMPLSNGVLNPAVAIGIGSLSVSHVAGPIVGGIIAANLAQWFTVERGGKFVKLLRGKRG